MTAGHVGDRRPIVEDLQNCLMALLPPSPAPHSEDDHRANTDLDVSPRNRGHCRPGTGAASRNGQTTTGATLSIMNRVRTSPWHIDWHPLAPESSTACGAREARKQWLTCAIALERVTGIEPAFSAWEFDQARIADLG